MGNNVHGVYVVAAWLCVQVYKVLLDNLSDITVADPTGNQDAQVFRRIAVCVFSLRAEWD